MEQIIQFCGAPMKIACDEKCHKAWGMNERPKIQLSDNEDDYCYLADGELGTAPESSPHLCCDEDKPRGKSEIPNKWCANECERCAMSEYGRSAEPLALTDFSKRTYNMPYAHPQS